MKIILITCLFFISINGFSSEFLENAKQDFLSPYTTNALTILEVGSGLTLTALLFRNAEKDSLQKTISRDKPLGKYSHVGYILGNAAPNIAYLLYMGTDYLFTNDAKSLERAILITKATAYADLTTEILKRSFNETRPNGGSLSFPSGHATCAFAFASVITMEHSLPWGIAANTMAAFVGLSRMNDNAHYLHDVLAGATIGTMYGVGLYYAEQKRNESGNKNSSVTFIAPIEKGLMGEYVLSF